MSRERIIYSGVLVLILAAFGAVYQFYFKEKLEQYRENIVYRDQLKGVLEQLQNTFGRVKPDVLASRWREEVQPWRDAVLERSRYFGFGDWREHPKYDEDTGTILRFWYDETSNEMILNLYQEVGQKMGQYNLVPQDLRYEFGVASLSDWEQANITEEDAYRNLAQLNFGMNVIRMFMDAEASYIQRISLWPPSQMDRYGTQLNFRPVGVHFSMTTENLVKFLDDLRTRERYFNVSALRITYPYICYPQEPMLDVQMVLSQAIFNELDFEKAASSATGSAEDAFRSSGMIGRSSRGSAPVEEEKESIPAYLWRMFKRYVLYMN